MLREIYQSFLANVVVFLLEAIYSYIRTIAKPQRMFTEWQI